MGRYYNGDIEGKFWFAVQSSDDASFFGGQESEPNYINYSFSEDDLVTINEGIQKCKDQLGDRKKLLDDFFKNCKGYNEKMITDSTGIPKEKVMDTLRWYARLELGEKIKKCVEEKRSCEFEAEL